MAKIEVIGYVKKAKVTKTGGIYFQLAERNREKDDRGNWVPAGSTYYSVFMNQLAFPYPPDQAEDKFVKVSGYFNAKDDTYTDKTGAEVKTKRLVINATTLEEMTQYSDEKPPALPEAPF